MRRLVLCIGVVGLSAMVNGQSQLPLKMTHIEYGPSSAPTAITANDLQHDARTNTVYARGDVRIETGHSTFTADDAEIHITNRAAVDLEIALRGNVHVSITPSSSR